MVYKLRPAQEVGRDLELIEDYLVQTYQSFGDDFDSAAARAFARIEEALDYMYGLSDRPHRGTEHVHIRPGLRSVTNSRFIYYFEVDDSLSEMRLLAIFFGVVDHQHQILDRLKH